MTLDPQNTMTKVVKDLVIQDGVIVSPEHMSYSADRSEIVASLKFLGFQISKIIQEIQVLKEDMKLVEWRIDHPGEDYYD